MILGHDSLNQDTDRNSRRPNMSNAKKVKNINKNYK